MPGRDILISSDELEIILEALHVYRETNDGRRNAGRITWTREKLVQFKREAAALRVIGA